VISLVVFVGVLAGLGSLGVIRGLYDAPPSLEALAATLDRTLELDVGPSTGPGTMPNGPGHLERFGAAILARFERSPLAGQPRWSGVVASLAVTGDTAERLASKVVVAGVIGLLGPPVLWLAALSTTSALPAGVAIAVGLLAAPLCAGVPFMTLAERAKVRRRHFRVVVGSFVDLVVLSLAGGVGIEGALLTASQMSSDWAFDQMGRVLQQARDTGESPWRALGRLGQRFAVPELEELSTSLQLAGTEGAKIRQSLSARAASLRRHEQAEAESAANAMTERLFLPGALLLIGFLFFVGYPAFSRILGGW
jgi:Flp pilus assembly protein TadB